MASETCISSLTIPKPNFPLRNKDGNADFYAEDFSIFLEKIYTEPCPVSIDMTTSETTEIIVDITIDESKAGQDFTLSGAFTGRGNLPLESHTFTAQSGENKISIKSHGHSTTVPWGAYGSITWTLKSAGEVITETIKFEIYAITPAELLPEFFGGEIPSELLEIFVLPTTEYNIKNYLEYAVAACHRSSEDKYREAEDLALKKKLLEEPALLETRDLPTPPVHRYHYNAWGGGSKFARGQRGGYFDLKSWLKYRLEGEVHSVNSYDQAALVQIVGSLGITRSSSAIDWYLMEPFGYIPETTDLVGWGLCNNPMIGLKGTSSEKEVVKPGDGGRRSCFDNHAFAVVGGPGDDGKVLDACVGPHVGKENLKQYISAATDTNVPENPYHDTATFETGNYKSSGVKGIKDRARRLNGYDMVELQHFDDLKNKSQVSGSTKTELIYVDITKLSEKLTDESRDVRFGPPTIFSHLDAATVCWTSLDSGAKSMTVSLEIYSKHQELQLEGLSEKEKNAELALRDLSPHQLALNALCQFVLSHTESHDKIFEEPKIGSEKGSYHLVGRTAVGLEAWVHGNMFVVVSRSAPREGENDPDLDLVANDFENYLQDSTIKPEEKETLGPVKTTLDLSRDSEMYGGPPADSIFPINVAAPNKILHVGYKLEHHTILQVSEPEVYNNTWYFTFKALAEGTETITISTFTNSSEIDIKTLKFKIFRKGAHDYSFYFRLTRQTDGCSLPPKKKWRWLKRIKSAILGVFTKK